MRKKLLIGLIVASCIQGCSSDSDSNNNESMLSEQSLIGRWSWQTAEVTDATNAQSGILRVGDKNCFEIDSGETPFCEETISSIIEICQELRLFDINFQPTMVYDRNENYSNNNFEYINNCEIIEYENEASDSFHSGTWDIEGDAIFSNETYRKTISIRLGEERESESFEQSSFVWQVLSFSNEAMTVFWRTPDQIDYEITFTKN